MVGDTGAGRPAASCASATPELNASPSTTTENTYKRGMILPTHHHE
jgi:hypothetical protein